MPDERERRRKKRRSRRRKPKEERKKERRSFLLGFGIRCLRKKGKMVGMNR